jgi:DNA-binding SARP family transcriptional activator
MSQLRVELFDGFRVTVDGHAVDEAAWRRRKPAALIKLLALAPSHRLHREAIMDALWPDLDPDAAGANLRKALHHARRALDESMPSSGALLASDADQVVLAPGALWLDVEQFRAELASARRGSDPTFYRQAIERVGAGLLPEDRFEDWASGPREELQRDCLAALEELARLLEANGELDAAVEVARQHIVADQLREEGHAALIRLCALAGRRAEALRGYERLTELLRDELGAEPSPATQQLYEEIRARQAHEPELTADLWERVGDLRLLSGDAVGATKAFELALAAGGAPEAIGPMERKSAEAWLMRHRPANAVPHLDKADALVSDPAERGRLRRARANLAWETGDFAAAQRFAEQARDLASAYGDAEDLAAAHEALAIVSHFKGDWRDGLESEMERLVADDLGPAQLTRVFDIHNCIGQYHLYSDSLANSVESYARRLLDRAEEASATRAQAFAWCLLGESLLLQARWDEADGCLAQSCDLHASLGARSGGLAWQRRAELAICRGDHAEADAFLRQAAAIATVSKMANHLWGRIHATAAFGAMEQGNPERAVRAVHAAAGAAARYGDCPTCSALLNPIAAEAYARLADPENARAYAAAAAGVARMFSSSAWSAMAETAAGSAALADGNRAAALRRFDAAHDLYARAGHAYWADRSRRLAVLA